MEKKNEIKKIILKKYKVKFCDDSLQNLAKIYNYALIGVGQIKDNKVRLKIFNNLKKLNFNLPSICSKHALVSKYSKIGEGSVVMHGAIIGPNVIIGKKIVLLIATQL